MAIIGSLTVLLLALAVGGFMVLVGAGYLTTYARLRRSDPVDVRLLHEPSGAVELAGTAAVHEEIYRSPFTGSETLVQEWKVREYNPGRRSSWRTLASDESTNQFVLEDGTGSVLVDPEGARHELLESITIEVGPDESPPPKIDRFLDAVDEVDHEHDQPRRYQESRLDPRDDVHVLGPVRESGHSFDMPGSVSAVIGVENPDDRGITIGEDGLDTIVEKVKDGSERFVLTNADESGAQRLMLKQGLVWLSAGLLFLAVPLGVVLFV